MLNQRTDLIQYRVERSDDGIHFSEISTLAKNATEQYLFRDNDLIKEKTFYRL